MKILIRLLIARARHLLWHCLWVTALFLVFPGGIAVAAPVNIGVPNPLHTINATVGQNIVGENIGTNAGGNVFWDFVTAPAGCSGGPTSYVCNNVTITLPAGSPTTAVPNTAETTVSGMPNAPGLFSFRLVVALEDGSASAERTFELDITQPSVPFDIGFVLDRSGSMSGSTNVSPPATTRWRALELGANGFTPLITETADEAVGESRFGLTLFSTGVLPNNSFPSGLVTIDDGLAAAVDAELGSQTPEGLTAMGAGLKAGIAKMIDATRPRVVVLFTDGEQNQAPQVNLDGRGYSDGTAINPSYPAGPGSVKIVTVGVGAPSGSYLTTLQNLAAENRGHAIITSNGSNFTGDCTGDVSAAFDCAIAPALAGNSPLMVDSYSGVLSADPVTLSAFEINHNLKQLLIKLSFSRNFEIPELQRLLAGVRISKDDTDITSYFQPIIVGNYTNTILLKTDFVTPGEIEAATAERLTSEGSYSIQLTRPTSLGEDLNYRLIPYADDARLDVEWGVSPTLPRVNQTLNPTVNLSWRGAPLTNATVEVVVLQPGTNLGDLLAKNPQKVDPSNAPDAGSPGYQKYLYLLQNDPSFLKQLASSPSQLTLTHRGNGRYTADYNPGDISGIHQFFYLIRATDPETGSPIQRLAVESKWVHFGDLDLNASSVDVQIDGRTIIWNWLPMTVSGYLIGPDQGQGISVDGIDLVNVQDNQDGSYTLTLTGDPNAPVTVKLLGEEIYQGSAGKFGQSRGLPSWLILLIVLLLLLLLGVLLWLWRRDTTSDSEP